MKTERPPMRKARTTRFRPRPAGDTPGFRGIPAGGKVKAIYKYADPSKVKAGTLSAVLTKTGTARALLLLESCYQLFGYDPKIPDRAGLLHAAFRGVRDGPRRRSSRQWRSSMRLWAPPLTRPSPDAVPRARSIFPLPASGRCSLPAPGRCTARNWMPTSWSRFPSVLPASCA